MTPREAFLQAKRANEARADALEAAKKQQAMAAIRPAPQPALMTADALQEKVLRPHQLEAIEQLGHPWDYAHSLAKRMYRVEKLEWLDREQLQGVMVALVYDAKRHGRPA